MRGKAPLRTAHSISRRITPAYAGKSSRPLRPPECRKDHPRVCGEKTFLEPKGQTRLGSPPRMRGKAGPNSAHNAASGITPAYAGKSEYRSFFPARPWDHPRVCGEKNGNYDTQACGGGSPPRMRGKADSPSARFRVHRITPAYAGKRLKRSRSTVPPVAIVPLFPSVCNKPVVSDGSPAGRDAPLFLPAENAVPASPAYNLRSL